MTKRVWFELSAEAFQEALGIPNDCVVGRVIWNERTGNMEVYVDGEQFPEALLGCLLPQVYPTIMLEHSREGYIVSKTWNWNLKEKHE